MKTTVNKSVVSHWGYKESFLFASILLISGFIINYLTFPSVIDAPVYPYNLILIISIVLYILLTGLFLRNSFFTWMSGIPASLSAISAFTFLILLMGFIPQQKGIIQSDFITRIGLSDITRSYAYLLTSLYLLFILGYTILRRAYPFNLKNIRFILNHGGLWIVIAAASAGSGDIVRLRINTEINNKLSVAFNEQGKSIQMPFVIELQKIILDEYLSQPNAKDEAFTNPQTGQFASCIKIYSGNNKPFEATIRVNHPVTFRGWKIYQYSYESAKGNSPEVSMLEMVKDSWLPVVYFGIFMMFAGAFLLFLKTKKTDL